MRSSSVDVGVMTHSGTVKVDVYCAYKVGCVALFVKSKNLCAITQQGGIKRTSENVCKRVDLHSSVHLVLFFVFAVF